MTADASNQIKSTTAGTMLPTLALFFAALTLLFALLSMFFGNRLATVSRNQVEAQNSVKASETTIVQSTAAALQEARKQVEVEKAGNEKLSKQLSAAMQEVKKLKTDLAKASQTIDMLKNKAAAAPASEPAASQPTTSQDIPPTKAAAAIDTGATPAPNTMQTETPPQLSGDAPEMVQDQSTPAGPGQVESQPQTMPPVQNSQQPRLEESSIQPGTSDAKPVTAGTSQGQEPAGPKEADAGQSSTKQTSMDRDAAE